VRVVPDSIARQADPRLSASECSWTDGGVDAAWVHVAGELDIATTAQLERALRESQVRARLVVLDLRELAFMDRSGVHAIVNASIRAREVSRRPFVLRVAPIVDRMFVPAVAQRLEPARSNRARPRTLTSCDGVTDSRSLRAFGLPNRPTCWPNGSCSREK
jgi:anti-sigma B factor antagonist